MKRDMHECLAVGHGVDYDRTSETLFVDVGKLRCGHTEDESWFEHGNALMFAARKFAKVHPELRVRQYVVKGVA